MSASVDKARLPDSSKVFPNIANLSWLLTKYKDQDFVEINMRQKLAIDRIVLQCSTKNTDKLKLKLFLVPKKFQDYFITLSKLNSIGGIGRNLL